MWLAAVAPSCAANSAKVPFAAACIATGLTIGTAHWLDASPAAITSGSATGSDVSVTAAEQ